MDMASGSWAGTHGGCRWEGLRSLWTRTTANGLSRPPIPKRLYQQSRIKLQLSEQVQLHVPDTTGAGQCPPDLNSRPQKPCGDDFIFTSLRWAACGQRNGCFTVRPLVGHPSRL